MVAIGTNFSGRRKGGADLKGRGKEGLRVGQKVTSTLSISIFILDVASKRNMGEIGVGGL